jgi:predicted outer membrane repeat protein
MGKCLGTWIAVVVLATSSAMAATFDVTRFDDPAGPCDASGCSLRQAVLAANATLGADNITLHAGTYRLTLPGDDATGETGDLDITDTVTIEGDPAGTTVIDARRARDRAFEVTVAGSLTLRNVTVKGGSALIDGGGILSVGTLIVENSLFTGNKAGNSGGAIASEAGTCTLTDVIITKNKAVTNDGGGCEFLGSTTATLLRVTISGNTAGDTGGAMDSDEGAIVSISDSTVSGNRSRHEGGGLDPSVGTVTLTNVTISGNHSAKGGGIQLESGGVLVLDHVTIAHNRAKEGAGLWTEAGTTATLTGTLIATNTPFDCFGPIVSNGSNLIGRIDGCVIEGDTTGNLVGGPKPLKPLDPHLGLLASNGGPTKTHALLPGSPAINAVVGACPPPTTDQRGLPRTGTCDIGAFEVQ